MRPIVFPCSTRRLAATYAGVSLLAGLPFIALAIPAAAQTTIQDSATEVVCGENGTEILAGNVQSAKPRNLVVKGLCQVTLPSAFDVKGVWKFASVNILANGILEFVEKPNSETDFWASSIIIENKGRMVAGRASQGAAAATGNGEAANQVLEVGATNPGTPFGALGGKLRIHLYGADQSKGKAADYEAQGAVCRSYEPTQLLDPKDEPLLCGIPPEIWNATGKVELPGAFPPEDQVKKQPKFTDHFYKYDALYRDGQKDSLGRVGYFGYKSIGLSYGGSLELYGTRGSLKPGQDEDPASSGNSWVRLGRTVERGATQLVLDREPGSDWTPAKWQAGDEIVVTTTDYLPSHSEQLRITAVSGSTVTFERSDCTPTMIADKTDGCPGLRYRHQGERFPLSRLNNAKDAKGNPRLTIDETLVKDGAETRAAVALLSRSITIMSEGDTYDETFEQATANDPTYAFGGHVVVRQGFEKLQVQGVEFRQLGQGGRKGHYPVHFHMARMAPPDTWVKDSSINESMTRWIVVHSTNNLTIARNVGYLSIGHGFYLEDSTEIDNRFLSNIGIHARAATDGAANPRRIPGILVDNTIAGDSFPFLSDGNHPAVFWITNNWNDFIGNAAVGAGTCGACYWLTPSYSEQNGHHGMAFEGYAALQKSLDFAGSTPLKSFYRNSCSSAMNSFMTINKTEPCQGVAGPGETAAPGQLQILPSKAPSRLVDTTYFPKVNDVPHATTCTVAATQYAGMPKAYDCSGVQVCSNGHKNCAVTVLDHYTTSFNWAAHNFAAIWLRQFWYLFDNSVITDSLTAGLTFVSGGDYTKSSAIEGYWALASNSVFVGETQPANPFAYSTGPVNKESGLACDYSSGNSCVLKNAGIALQKSNWGVNQRLFSIYDGPNYQDSNAYLDIKTRTCNKANGCIWATDNTVGVRKDPAKYNDPQVTNKDDACYSPNAAIAWKQPNGFYYPPAFHSSNLYFDNVEIRHYVIAPVFKPTQPLDGTVAPNFGQGGSYLSDTEKAKLQYCYFPETSQPTDIGGYDNFTDIDRQTELNDDDGSLTGFSRTISVNEDPFFNAPVETPECKSNIGVDPGLVCAGAAYPSTVVPTARTSPYDYVTTVMIPDCATQPGLCGPSAEGQNHFGTWANDCGGPFCYGVPIFRQYLNGKKAAGSGEWKQWQAQGCDDENGGVGKAACRWPFLRMAGQATWQRSNLTANHGSYYVDTTVSEATQRTEKFSTSPDIRSVNVFQKEKTYMLMFLFAKNTTRQTYRLYVGSSFDKEANVKAVRGDISTKDIKFTADGSVTSSQWLTTSFDGAKGILTINIDFKNAADLTPSPANDLCQPKDFCTADGDSCGCALKPEHPLMQANPKILASCKNACGNWAMKDLDCPKGGCYAVGVTLGSDFAANDVQHRPQPEEFPGPTVMSLSPGSGDRGWETLFSRTATLPDGLPLKSTDPKGACYYDKVPGAADCLPPPN